MDAELFGELSAIGHRLERVLERGPGWVSVQHEQMVSGCRSALDRVCSEMLAAHGAAVEDLPLGTATCWSDSFAGLFGELSAIFRQVEQVLQPGPGWTIPRHRRVVSGCRNALGKVLDDMLRTDEAAQPRPELFGIGRSLPEGDR